MISYTTGNIFESGKQVLVNPVNCVGVMGRGLAKQFRGKFPDNFNTYAAACANGEMVPGNVLMVLVGGPGPVHYIANFPTKRHWRDSSRLDDIEMGLASLYTRMRVMHLNSVAIPAIGCGLGGLDWNVVRPKIEHAFFRSIGTDVVIYEPRR